MSKQRNGNSFTSPPVMFQKKPIFLSRKLAVVQTCDSTFLAHISMQLVSNGGHSSRGPPNLTDMQRHPSVSLFLARRKGCAIRVSPLSLSLPCHLCAIIPAVSVCVCVCVWNRFAPTSIRQTDLESNRAGIFFVFNFGTEFLFQPFQQNCSLI